MPENNSSTDTATALAELLDRTEILEQKMQKNIDENRKISSNMKSMIEMLRDMETRLDDWLGVPHLAEKPPLEQIFSPPLLPTPGSTTMIHVEIPSRHQQQVLHNYTTEPTDSTIVTQVRLCKPVFPTFHGDDANSFEITAQNMKLISKSEFLVLGCSDSFCIQGVRQNDCEKLNLFLPLEKPSAKFATAMKETDTNYKVLVDVYSSVKTGWIWFEEPPSLRDDTRHLRTDSNDADMMESIGSRESLKKNIQVGYYFSYNNLSRDNFLKKTVPESEYGIVSMSLICMFPRMGGHLAVWDVKVDEKAVELVADTLISSTSLENFEDDKKVGRVTEFTNREEVIEQVNNRTVATAPLPYDAKAEDSESFFCQLAKVNSIGLTKHVAGKKMFSGTVLIEFSSEKEADYVLKLNLSVASVQLELRLGEGYEVERENSATEFENYQLHVSSKLKHNSNAEVNCSKRLIDLLARAGISALQRAKIRNMERLVLLTCGGEAVNVVYDLTEKNVLSWAGLVYKHVLGEEKYTFVKGVKNPDSCTILIKEPNNHTIALIKDAVCDGLRMVKNTIEDEAVIWRVGAFEVAARQLLLNDVKKTVKGRGQLVVQAFTDALLVVPKTLAENAGLDTQDVIIDLIREHDNGNIVVPNMQTCELVSCLRASACKMKRSRFIYNEISLKFPLMTFIVKSCNEKRARLWLLECASHDLLQLYPVFHEKLNDNETDFKVPFTRKARDLDCVVLFAKITACVLMLILRTRSILRGEECYVCPLLGLQGLSCNLINLVL